MASYHLFSSCYLFIFISVFWSNVRAPAVWKHTQLLIFWLSNILLTDFKKAWGVPLSAVPARIWCCQTFLSPAGGRSATQTLKEIVFLVSGSKNSPQAFSSRKTEMDKACSHADFRSETFKYWDWFGLLKVRPGQSWRLSDWVSGFSMLPPDGRMFPGVQGKRAEPPKKETAGMAPYWLKAPSSMSVQTT